MTSLATFEAPLLRLILCGGGGLAGAYGELHDGVRYWLWDARHNQSVRYSRDLGGAGLVFDCPAKWSLPLDPASPWHARLALVAAWMASAWMPSGAAAEVVLGECWLHLYTYSGGVADVRAWACNNGGNIEPGAVRLDLPTLPTYLSTHPPVVALLLALYDVPEIRAQVENP